MLANKQEVANKVMLQMIPNEIKQIETTFIAWVLKM